MGDGPIENELTTTSSTPTLARLRSPPDKPLINGPPTIVSAHDDKPSSFNIRVVSKSNCDSVVERGNRNLAEKRIASRGVAVICKESSCATKAMDFRILILVGSTE